MSCEGCIVWQAFIWFSEPLGWTGCWCRSPGALPGGNPTALGVPRDGLVQGSTIGKA